MRAVGAMRYERVPNSMQQTLSQRAMGEPVITRLFGKDRGILKILDESRRSLVSEVRCEAFPLTRGTLPERWVPIGGLIQLRV